MRGGCLVVDCGDGIGTGRLAMSRPSGLVDGGGDIISSSEQLSDSQSLPWASLAHAASSHDDDGEPLALFVVFGFALLAKLGCRRAYCTSGCVDGDSDVGERIFEASVIGARSKSCDNEGTLIRGGAK